GAAGVARAGERGSRAGQLARPDRYAPWRGRLPPARERGGQVDEPVRLPEGLRFFNGWGGFTPDGREYCVLVQGPPPPDRGRNGPPAHHQAATYPHPPPAPCAHAAAT